VIWLLSAAAAFILAAFVLVFVIAVVAFTERAAR